MNRRTRALTVLTLTGACALAATGTAAADTTHSTLRVEGADGALEAGTNYSNASVRTRNSSACGKRNSKREQLQGANATGLVAHGSRANDRLSPFRTSDTFDFGVIVCRIGGFTGFGSQAWLYKVNHESPSVGGDQVRVGRGDDVLWYYANFNTRASTGDELELRNVPVHTNPGEAFEVRAVAYDRGGTASPAANVQISGAAAAPTDADGRTTVVAGPAGTRTLRGERGNDIPAAPVEVCVNADRSECPSRRGEEFVGTGGEDRIVGTRGDDRIRAGGGRDVVSSNRGDDRVNVRGGGRDRVSCGRGQDVVRADRDDAVRGNCERVKRKR